jgi:cytoskeletal protein RodZ
VAAGFRTRRIKTEGSIGDKLKRSRIRKKITVAEVEESTRIRAKFLLALEGDSWDQIPSEVYGRGYLETYSQFLGLDKEGIMQQYDRERHMYARHCVDSQVDLSPRSRLVIPRVLLTPRFFVIVLALAFSCGFIGIIFHQVRAFAAAPYLQVTSPSSSTSPDTSELKVSADFTDIRGEASPGSVVTINGELVDVDVAGHFSKKEALHTGLNAFSISATNNHKTTTSVISVSK